MRYLLLIPICIALFLTPRHKTTYVSNKVYVDRVVPDQAFSKANLIAMLKGMNVKHYRIAYAQAVVETGNFTSRVFQLNNNLFGMKVSCQRANTCSGSRRGHAYYVTWDQSVVDYALYYNKYLSRLSECELYKYLGRHYASDKNYVTKLKQIACEVK